MIAISLDHLNIEWPANIDPDELTIDDLVHPIFHWAVESDINVTFEIRFQEVEDQEDGSWDLVWSTDPRLFAVFGNSTDAIAFVLAWGGGAI